MLGAGAQALAVGCCRGGLHEEKQGLPCAGYIWVQLIHNRAQLSPAAKMAAPPGKPKNRQKMR